MNQFEYFRYNTEFIEELLASIKKVKMIIDSLTITLENLKQTLNPEDHQ